MKKRPLIHFMICCILAFYHFPSEAQQVKMKQIKRALYVDNFDLILGNSVEENKLLAFANHNRVTTLLLYNLHIVHQATYSTENTYYIILSEFIHKAKTIYGVNQIGAVGENLSFFKDVIEKFNNSQKTTNEKIDIYNLEFEFWNEEQIADGGYYCQSYLKPNKLPCTNAEAFNFALTTLIEMKKIADKNQHNISVETYIGWPSSSQAKALGQVVNKIRIHGYVRNHLELKSYIKDRVKLFHKVGSTVETSIILSSEKEFMKGLLLNRPFKESEALILQQIPKKSALRKHITEFTYFNYSQLTN